MALSIGTNVQSLNAQRNLASSQNSLNTSIQRLTSGMRINSAKDDSAGSAISNRFTAQIRGLNQAVRNSNDGISLAQTAEGALQETTNLLQRMRELAVQSVNDTNTASDRSSIQAEMDQLFKEVDRIAGTTKFNGKTLLDGSAKNSTFQVGANAGDTLSVSISAADTKALALNSTGALGELNSGRINAIAATLTVAKDDVLINGKNWSSADTTLTQSATGALKDNAKVIADAINSNSGVHGVTAKAYNTVKSGVGASGITDGTMTINGATIAASGSVDELVTNINRDAMGVTAVLNADRTITLSNDTGRDIEITNAGTGSGFTNAINGGFIALTSANGSAISVTKGTAGTTADIQALGLNASSGSSSVVGGSVNATATGNGSTIAGLLATDVISINGVALSTASGNSAADKATAINALTEQTGVTASASTNVKVDINSAGLDTGGNLYINGNAVVVAATGTVDDLVTAINDAGIQGVIATTTNDGKLSLTSNGGQNIWLADDDGGANILGAAVDQSGGTAADITGATAAPPATTDGNVFFGQLTLSGKDGAAVRVDGDAAAVAKLGMVTQGGSSEVVKGGLDVSNAANATNAIKRIDEALAKIDENRGSLGAFQNRMQSTISNLQNVSENLSGARGRIMDADFAAETSNMTKQNILQQAGIAMLAQSNQNSQQVLSLLR